MLCIYEYFSLTLVSKKRDSEVIAMEEINTNALISLGVSFMIFLWVLFVGLMHFSQRKWTTQPSIEGLPFFFPLKEL